MSCPNCGGTQTDINELDGSTCCLQCGTVIDDAPFRTTLDETTGRFTAREAKEKKTVLLDNFLKAAAFFELPEDLIARGKELIKEHKPKLKTIHPREVAVYIVYAVSHQWKPFWNLQDFVQVYPIPLDIRYINSAHSIINKEGQIVKWRTPQQDLEGFILRLYPIIVKQVYKDSPKIARSALTLPNLKEKTRAILDLAGRYNLNTGKKARPSITAAAMIAGLWIRVTSLNHKKRKTRPISALRWFNYSEFVPVVLFGRGCLSSRLDEYLEFLYTCATYIPWIKNLEKRFVHYHLQDILQLYGSSKPAWTLTLDHYEIKSFRRSREAREQMERWVTLAQSHLDQGTQPKDCDSLEYCIFKLLQFGFEEYQIIHYSHGYIRNMAHCLTLRDTLDSYPKQKDLEKASLDENDMNEQEVALYLN
ncbi:hypothetical protein CU098_006212 [Rhizopus stolonifer]|uniref:BRF2-like C-terminal domain-containing protein n=1 Tax=Rhizopus stolonifer TaxID=4846 RepID=A0A367JLP2_RHIST|nr:hypothetical protein CU098_006212 [Rhizopus stolonifer]